MSTIKSFVSEHAAVRPNADIHDRWESRIISTGMNRRGKAGADSYMGQYGKGMKSPKAVMFARIAEIKDFPDMASRFWEIAYTLETGLTETLVPAAQGSEAPAVELPKFALKESFGQKPELLTVLDRDEAVRLASDPRYGIQEKKDGRRLLVRAAKVNGSADISAGNKKGLSIVPSLGISEAVAKLGGSFLQLDGEDVNGVYHVFDLLSMNGVDLRGRPYSERHAALALVASGGAAHPNLKVVPLITTKDRKLALIEELRGRGAEGYVIKPLDEPYTPGVGNQRKHQFRATSSFVVGVRNGTKNSVGISVFRADGSRRDMGNLTISGSRPIPSPGSIAEVEYLYCHVGSAGKLHQPVLKEIRSDSVAGDCQESKIRCKAVIDEDEDESNALDPVSPEQGKRLAGFGQETPSV